MHARDVSGRDLLRTQERPTRYKDHAGIHVELFACAGVTPDTRIDRLATRKGSTLDRLRAVSESLAAWAGSTLADTARWVLEGESLRWSALPIEVRLKAPVQARSRLALTVVPTCSLREVARAYWISWSQWCGRLRRLTDEHARLAAFANSHRRLCARGQMEGRNRQTRKSRQYRQLSVFVRDARHAVQRLTDLKLSVSLKR